jgi:hypothetical protein
MKAYSFKIKLLLIISLLGLVQISYADNKDKVSLEQASEKIRKQSKGKVLSATTKNHNGIESHRIQVLTKSGRIKIYQVPTNKNQLQNKSNTNQNRSLNPSNYRTQNSNNRSAVRERPSRQSSQSRLTTNRNSSSRTNSSSTGSTRSQPKSNTRSSNKPSSSNGDN